MNCCQFSNLLCYLCLPSAVITCVPLTKEVVRLNTYIFTNIFYKCCIYSVYSVEEFHEGKLDHYYYLSFP